MEIGPHDNGFGRPTWRRGTIVGRYRLVRQIAVGGMAELHLAVAQGPCNLATLVVLKRVRPEFEGRHDMHAMLVDEARLGARFAHRNLVDVLDLANVDGVPFYVMRYVLGADLRSILQEARRSRVSIPVPLAVYIAAQLSSALHHAHELRDTGGRRLGVIHRDVSTSNVRVSLSGGVTLLDFGVAKSRTQSADTDTGIVKGNAAYMAPEQCRGESLDRRADVFALGAVLYELVTMRRLFVAPSPIECMQQVCLAPIVPPSAVRPDLPVGLEEVILRALERDPNRRFASAADMLEALERVTRDNGWSADGSTLSRFMELLFQRPRCATEPVVARDAVRGLDERSADIRTLRPRPGVPEEIVTQLYSVPISAAS